MSESHELDPARVGDHLDRLYRAARALCGSAEMAEDMVQETFARVLARPRFLRGDDDLGYLLRALRNTYLSQRRTEGRRPVTEPLEDEPAGAVASVPRQPEEAAEERLVYAAIAGLPEEFRLALVAVDVAGLSYREAARALRVREGTLTTRLFRGRARVARELGSGQSPRPEPPPGGPPEPG